VKRNAPETVLLTTLDAAPPEPGRSSTDDWSDEASRQAQQLNASPPDPLRLFAEFRRKLPTGEALSRAAARLAEALRFSGRITITFHQGKLTKTTLEESYFKERTAM
jgi:hypothetical protein